MPLFGAGAPNYVGVRDIQAAVAWYAEKLGLRPIKVEMDDCADCIVLGFSKEEWAVTVGPIGASSEEFTHSFVTGNVTKAHEYLNSRGVQVSDIQQDRQGTRYFEMRDLEGNAIEITEEP
jgi:catechol 2,3-dioxygenase-like lactoylglutathione lyase family enzyme